MQASQWFANEPKTRCSNRSPPGGKRAVCTQRWRCLGHASQCQLPRQLPDRSANCMASGSQGNQTCHRNQQPQILTQTWDCPGRECKAPAPYSKTPPARSQRCEMQLGLATPHVRIQCRVCPAHFQPAHVHTPTHQSHYNADRCHRMHARWGTPGWTHPTSGSDLTLRSPKHLRCQTDACTVRFP